MTTILAIRKNNDIVIAGDGQVSLGQTVMKSNAKKIRRLGKDGKIIVGFAGATADAFTLFERLEAKLEAHPGQLTRACVELAKDWRTDKYLRKLEALMAVCDASTSLILTGNGDVVEPEDGKVEIQDGSHKGHKRQPDPCGLAQKRLCQKFHHGVRLPIFMFMPLKHIDMSEKSQGSMGGIPPLYGIPRPSLIFGGPHATSSP